MDRQQILIVDDEKINRMILIDMFQEEYDTVEARNGKEAIAQIKEHPDISLILLDLRFLNICRMRGFLIRFR